VAWKLLSRSPWNLKKLKSQKKWDLMNTDNQLLKNPIMKVAWKLLSRSPWNLKKLKSQKKWDLMNTDNQQLRNLITREGWRFQQAKTNKMNFQKQLKNKMQQKFKKNLLNLSKLTKNLIKLYIKHKLIQHKTLLMKANKKKWMMNSNIKLKRKKLCKVKINNKLQMQLVNSVNQYYKRTKP
jgi:hypothetical protein